MVVATHLESSAWCGLANVAVSKQHLQLGAIKGLAHVFLATPRGLDALLKGLGANISDDDGRHVVGDGRRTVGDGPALSVTGAALSVMGATLLVTGAAPWPCWLGNG
jgi:hypothetical protein